MVTYLHCSPFCNHSLPLSGNAASPALQVVHMTTNETGRNRNVKREERPQIELGCNESQWSFFVDEWNSYKRRKKLSPGEEVDELRASYSKELRKTLFDFVGSANLQGIAADQLVEHISKSIPMLCSELHCSVKKAAWVSGLRRA